MRRLNSRQEAWIRRFAGAMPFYKRLGITLTKASWGSVEIQLNVTRGLTQSAGFAHGGVAAALIDSAVGLSLWTTLDPQELITTVELHVNYIAPGELGVLKGRGKIIHKGKRIAVGDAEVRDGNGRLVSKGSATYMIIGKSRQSVLDSS